MLALNKYGFKRAVAVEAHPKTFATLNKNIHLNGLGDKIIAVNAAVGPDQRQVTFAEHKYRTGINRIVSSDAEIDKETFIYHQIITKPFDSIRQERGVHTADIGFIKIDVEGHEYQALQGMKDTLTSVTEGTLLFVEIWDSKHDQENTFEFLEGLSFKLLERSKDNCLFIKL